MSHPINGWINLYKPLGITSAKAVSAVKRLLPKGTKIGHTGTLDPEAEGVLPLAIGEATKLVQFLMDAQKTYRFKIQFGSKTDTADKVGKVIDTTDIIPTKTQCYDVCAKFTGEITQTPPAFSALKINGVRAYDLARQNKEVNLAPRKINIFALECVAVDEEKATATYVVECSKGTYVRTLAEDISLSLQSLGFVLELARTKVGIFDAIDSVYLEDLSLNNVLRVETILDDIPVLDIDDAAAYKVRCGQEVLIPHYHCHPREGGDPQNAKASVIPAKAGIHKYHSNYACLDMDPRLRGDDNGNGDDNDHLIWLRYEGKLLAVGRIYQDRFESTRVFNL